jgi:hypothetical protein
MYIENLYRHLYFIVLDILTHRDLVIFHDDIFAWSSSSWLLSDYTGDILFQKGLPSTSAWNQGCHYFRTVTPWPSPRPWYPTEPPHLMTWFVLTAAQPMRSRTSFQLLWVWVPALIMIGFLGQWGQEGPSASERFTALLRLCASQGQWYCSRKVPQWVGSGKVLEAK